MNAAARRARIRRLRQHLERFEKPIWAKSPPHDAAGAQRPFSLLGGVLHETRAQDWRDAAAATGFSLALAALKAKETAKPVIYLQLAHEARRDGALFGRGLSALGVDLSLFTAGFARDMKQLLWAAEEAAGSPDVAAVLVDAPQPHPLLDLTATRRLQLAVAGSGAAALLNRTQKIPEPTAAAVRWRLGPAPARAHPFDNRAACYARWRVVLERCRQHRRLMHGGGWEVEWRHDEQDLVVIAKTQPGDEYLAAALAKRPHHDERRAAAGRKNAARSL